MPSEFQRLLEDLEDLDQDRERLKKALDWIDEIRMVEDVERLQALDREITARPREIDLFKALDPRAVVARQAEHRARAADGTSRLAGITSRLKAIRAEIPPNTTLEKASMEFDFAAARETLRQAAINGEAPALELIKAERTLNQLQAPGSTLAKALMPSAADRASEAHCRRLLNEVVAAGLPAVEAPVMRR